MFHNAKNRRREKSFNCCGIVELVRDGARRNMMGEQDFILLNQRMQLLRFAIDQRGI